MYQLCFYVPKSHLEQVKKALFNEGAGKIGDYDCCSWETPGQGQFRPLNGSNPFLGEVDKLESVPEYRVEMVCVESDIPAVISELIKIHPYETPAYSVSKIYTLDEVTHNVTPSQPKV